MGKGDRKTRKGKIFAGSFGKYRPKAKNKLKADNIESKETKETSVQE